MDHLQKIIIAFEMHDADGIADCFKHGVNPNQLHKGQPLIYELINMYSRGAMFKKCIRMFADHGLEFPDKVLLAVLLDDALMLREVLEQDTSAIHKTYTFACAFTPLYEATLLHICAEYNHLSCARVLVQFGATIDARAGIDAHGFGGQTPIFHTVNQDANKSLEMLQFLLEQKADLSHTIKGLIWGKGYEWETFIPAVNPLSYAMMGLLRQFQRTEQDIYAVVSLLLKAAYGIDYTPENIPNRYLGH